MKRALILASLLPLSLAAQERERPNRPPGPGGRGGFGGVREERQLLDQFDKDNNERLDAAERKAAYEFVQKEPAQGRGGRRFGPRSRDENAGPIQPGPKLSPSGVKNYGDEPIYDPAVYRTFFLNFENEDWSKEMTAFYNSDVEMPATLIVDDKTYKDVGVHYRGASSFFSVAEGRKRSMNVDVDFVHEGQNVGGYSTFNLLNSHRDPTFVRTVLYYQIAREYLPAPKANLVRVVINGESWGSYVSAQQFNKDFIQENFGTTKGARWKVPGSPRGNGGLVYLGEDPATYKRLYEIKTKDDTKSWTDFIKLCRVLNTTAPDQLEKELSPLLDIDGVLKFLALENVFINSDGYWIRSSDYNIYQDPAGKFHIIPHDANETFGRPEGPGANREVAGSGFELHPLTGSDDDAKPLLSKLLAVPSLKQRYFGYVRHMAENWLDWERIRSIAESYQGLIAADIKTDHRKLDSTEAFEESLTQDAGRRVSLKSFVEERRAYLLGLPEVRNAPLPGN